MSQGWRSQLAALIVAVDILIVRLEDPCRSTYNVGIRSHELVIDGTREEALMIHMLRQRRPGRAILH